MSHVRCCRGKEPMLAHLKYGVYFIQHKYFVFVAGRKTGAPLWRLIIHDWSKLTPAEWGPYVRSFYGPQPRTNEVKAAFNEAWLHHIHRNPHHWQHHVLLEDDGPVKPLMIPSDLIREMVADWAGAGRAITGRWDLGPWYAANRGKQQMEATSRLIVDQLVREITNTTGMWPGEEDLWKLSPPTAT